MDLNLIFLNISTKPIKAMPNNAFPLSFIAAGALIGCLAKLDLYESHLNKGDHHG
jgi:hypothetical protein